MPLLGTNFTFEDFLQRLERSPVAHMQPLYHDNRQLFVHRPDMLERAIMSVSWERGRALLRAAYYAQPLEPSAYRSLLARMVLHNRHVRRAGAGALVPWRAALAVYDEAMGSFGDAVPSAAAVSTLRLLEPHREWRAALAVLQTSQANRLLTKPAVLEAAHVCACPGAWGTALRLLAHLHRDEPELLPATIQALRPPGTDAFTAAERQHAVLAPGADEGPTPAQRHTAEVLAAVVAVTPPAVALQHPLCHSFVTHLAASTTLAPATKTRLLSTALTGFSWQQTVRLLSAYAEPTLLSDDEWKQLPAAPATAGDGGGGGATEARTKKSRSRRKKRLAQREAGAAPSSAILDAEADDALMSASEETAAAAVTPAEKTFAVLQASTSWTRAPPAVAATLVAVMADKLPSVAEATAFLRLVSSHQQQQQRQEQTAATDQGQGEAGGAGPALLEVDGAPGAASQGWHAASSLVRHPTVTQALLRKCAAERNGWEVAVPLLLSLPPSSSPGTEVLSRLALQLWAAREVTLGVRLLTDHVVPAGTRLTADATEALYECVLAQTRANLIRALRGETDASSTAPAPQVHWVSALSWFQQLQAPSHQARVARTGTGVSSGAPALRPTAVVAAPAPAPVSEHMLSLLIYLSVLGGSADGALRAVASAREAPGGTLWLADEIKAMLYCMKYDRPFEASAVLKQAATKYGEERVRALSQLYEFIRVRKELENLQRKQREV